MHASQKYCITSPSVKSHITIKMVTNMLQIYERHHKRTSSIPLCISYSEIRTIERRE